MARTKVDANTRRRIVAAAHRGLTYADIAFWSGVSRERVRQIIIEDDPEFVSPRAPHLRPPPTEPPEPDCIRECFICDRPVCPPQKKYCGEHHREVAKVFRQVTELRANHHRDVAKWIMSNSEDEAQRRWAERVLRGEGNVGQKRWLLKGSKTYKVLAEHGLLERLPEGFEIR